MKMVWEKWPEKVKEGSKFKCIKKTQKMEFLYMPPEDERVVFEVGKKYSVIKYEDGLAIAMKNGVFLLPSAGRIITWEYVAEYFRLLNKPH